MDSRSDIFGNYALALELADRGYATVPVRPLSKVPAIKWGRYQNNAPSEEDYRSWFLGTQHNIAVMCGDLIIVDVDDLNELDFALSTFGETTPLTQTPGGGVHLPYAAPADVPIPNRQRIADRGVDVRGAGGLALIPNSRTTKGAYRWLRDRLPALDRLPTIRTAWLDRPLPHQPAVATYDGPAEALWSRGRRYVDRLPPAVSGECGHRTAFIAALKIATFVGGATDVGWQLLRYFNATRSFPPFREDTELRHKWNDALRARSRTNG